MEYVVLFEGNVVWGPRAWSSFSVEHTLQSMYSVDVSLPIQSPALGVVDTNPNIVVLRAITEQVPPFDSIFQTLAGPFYRINIPEGVANVYYEVVDTTPAYAKLNLKAHISNVRWQAETSGISVDINGKLINFKTDREEQHRIYLQSSFNNNVSWKIDGEWIELTGEQVRSVASAINSHVQRAFQWEASLISLIESSETLDELKSINLVLN